MGKKIVVTALTSAIAGNFIKHIKKYDIITVGRHASATKYDFLLGKSYFTRWDNLSLTATRETPFPAPLTAELVNMGKKPRNVAFPMNMSAYAQGFKAMVLLMQRLSTEPSLMLES